MRGAATSSDLLTGLLRQVSRSFYLTLRVLPAAVRPQIGLAYLLARATDTLADTEILPVDRRLRALEALREAILGHRLPPTLTPEFGDFAGQQAAPGERQLLERIGEALALLDTLADADRQRVREVLTTITSGQELDLKRFRAASAEQIVALADDAELDDYTYRVAGCVGEFWTQLCRAHVFSTAPLDDAGLLADGVRFGKGLQLVNILRDLPRDLRQGRCYLPADGLTALGLAPRDLMTPANERRFRPLYNQLLDLAAGHLTAGWGYTNTLPWGCLRVRLACAWPVLIGADTLGLLRARNPLDPAAVIKINRRRVRWLMLQTLLCYPFPGVWQKLLPPTRRRP